MASGHPAKGLLARIGHILFLVHLLVAVLAHPFGNHSASNGWDISYMPSLSKRASWKEFLPLSYFDHIYNHYSCSLSGLGSGGWDDRFLLLKEMASHPFNISLQYSLKIKNVARVNTNINKTGRAQVSLMLLNKPTNSSIIT